MKIYCITDSPPTEKDQIEKLQALGEFEIIRRSKLSAEELISLAHDVEILILGSSSVERLDQKILTGLTSLKFISILNVGYDWVDLESARKEKTPISNVKGSNAESVVEHTWAMILDLAKRVNEFNFDSRTAGKYNFHDYVGKEVFGKTLGVVGLGDIGKGMARVGKSFDMKILAVNKSEQKFDGVEIVKLDQLLARSDVITICLPLDNTTVDFISEKEISKMKDGVILVNCARPQIVNKAAILEAVKSGRIFGYGIDAEIMKPVDEEYLNSPRVLATAHNAFNTVDAERRTFDVTIKNIETFLSGHPQNLIT